MIQTGTYRHYKSKLYEVLGLTVHSETGEELVLYKALYKCKEFPKNQLWVRPKDMFFETVVTDGVEKPRFEYMGNKKYENIGDY